MALQVREGLKLPDRTKKRLAAESDLQRVQKPHDIRSAIPMVDYTNPAKFPPYVFREFPKMPLLDNNRPIVIDESGGVLVFYDTQDEAEFKDMNPDIADEIERNAPEKAYADRVAVAENTIEGLRAKLRAAGIEENEKKPTNKLGAVTRQSVPPIKKVASEPVATNKKPPPEPTDGITLPKNKTNPLKKN